MKKTANWYGLEMLPLYLEIITGQLAAAVEQLHNLEACKHRPHVLDDAIIDRIIKLHTEQNESTSVPIEQCRKWCQQNPSPQQLADIKKIESDTQELEKINTQVLFLAQNFKVHTIDRILEKEDGELALDFLMGNLYPPHESLSNHYHDFENFVNPDEPAIKKFYSMKPQEALVLPRSLAKLYQEYTQQRRLLNDYNLEVMKVINDEPSLVMEVAKELGNIDPEDGKAVIQNYAEMNIFYDYLALYRQKRGKRYVCDWLHQHLSVLNDNNKHVVMAHSSARFAVLRLDRKMSYGAIQVVDIIAKKSYLLIDKALHSSIKEGCFFCCSILDMGTYIMTSGGGIPVDGRSNGGKAILTLVAKHLPPFRRAKSPIAPGITEGVKNIYGFCLRQGTLTYITTNDVY